MKFRTVFCTGLPASSSPFRVEDEKERELDWANRFLDMQCIRGIAPLTLRSCAHTLLYFVRWWSRQPGVDVTYFSAEQFTESTLIDYVRDQLQELPKPNKAITRIVTREWDRASPPGVPAPGRRSLRSTEGPLGRPRTSEYRWGSRRITGWP